MSDDVLQSFRSRRFYGLLVIGPPFVVLYANETACVLIQRPRYSVVGAQTWALPKDLSLFCTNLLDMLYDRHFDEVFTSFQLERKIEVAGKTLDLRGVGHPLPDGLLESFAYIIIEEILDRCQPVVGIQSGAMNTPSILTEESLVDCLRDVRPSSAR